MNLIDPIKSNLALINPDIPSWRLQVKTTKHLCSAINAYNEIEYKGRFNARMAGFYLQYSVNHISFDIKFVKIVFNQIDIKNQRVRERLAREMIEKLKLNELTPRTDPQLELEKAARIILSTIKDIK